MVIKFAVDMKIFEFDYQAYNARVGTRICRQFVIGARKFYVAVMKKIPYYNSPDRPSEISTGFVAGAFNNLRDALGGNFGAGTTDLNVSAIENLKELGIESEQQLQKKFKMDMESYLEGLKKLQRFFENAAKRQRQLKRVKDPKTGKILQVPPQRLPKEMRDPGVKGPKGKMIDIGKYSQRIHHHRGQGLKIIKSPQAARGSAYSTQPGDVFSSSVKSKFANERMDDVTSAARESETLTREAVPDNRFIFTYAVNINYFIWQEFGMLKGRGRSPYSPWLAMEAGKQAFLAHLNSHVLVDSFPDINDFFNIIHYTVSVDGTISQRKEPLIVSKGPPPGEDVPLPAEPEQGPGKRKTPGRQKGRPINEPFQKIDLEKFKKTGRLSDIGEVTSKILPETREPDVPNIAALKEAQARLRREKGFSASSKETLRIAQIKSRYFTRRHTAYIKGLQEAEERKKQAQARHFEGGPLSEDIPFRGEKD